MMSLDRGFWTIARFRSAPIRVHWSVPLGMVVFTRFTLAPGAWLAFFLLVLGHELGHALMVKLAKGQVLSVDVMGYGGMCRWSGSVTTIERSMIAWGGVLAQLLMLVLVQVALRFDALHFPGWYDFAGVMIDTNLFIMAINLLPIRPLDGAEAWPLFPALMERWRRYRRFKKELNRHLKVAPPPPPPNGKPRTPDPKRDEIFERMVKEATQNRHPIEPDDGD